MMKMPEKRRCEGSGGKFLPGGSRIWPGVPRGEYRIDFVVFSGFGLT
jgi:hypothetical protein